MEQHQAHTDQRLHHIDTNLNTMGQALTGSAAEVSRINGSVTRASGRRGILTVDVGVDVPDVDLRAVAASAGPRLRAQMVQVVQSFAASLRPGEPPDVHRLSRDLQFAVNQALGRRGARVLLGTVMVV